MFKLYQKVIGLLLACCLASISVYAAVQTNEFAVRGIYIDMRTQVMTLPALKSTVKKAAAEGINTVIMEYEASFPFDKHATLCNAYHFTADEVNDFVQYCTSVGVDVIPLQNCFGHCEYILQHDRYATLRESKRDMSQVCPMRTEEAKQVFGEIFREVARLHPSPYFHIGADETRLLGNCKHCKLKMEKQGISKLFVDYVKEMCKLVLDMGKKPIIWADMILQHPEALNEIPAETIIIDWNYGWNPKHFGNVDALVQQGFTVWGASALRSSPDNVYLTQWGKHFENLSTFIPFGREHGYKGFINTSWSTSGRYGYVFDNGWEVMDLQPVRQVYPLAGFDILQRAYADALKNEKWNAQNFISKYGKEHFGFDEAGVNTLTDYLFMPQEMVSLPQTDATKIEQVLKQCTDMRLRFGKLTPKQNAEDFCHLLLMLDIRINYLKFKQSEKVIESDRFDASLRKPYAEKLRRLIKESERLRKQFERLNAGYLKNPGASFGTWDYVTKMQRIHQCFIAQRP